MVRTQQYSRSRWMLVLAAALALMAFWSTVSAAPTTITYYMATGQEDWTVWTKETAKLFEKQNPNIKVDVQMGSYDKLMTMISGGVVPDVIHFDGGSTAQYAELGLLAPLDSFLKSEPRLINQYFPPLINSAMWKGQLYGLPRAWSAVALVYNEDLMLEGGVGFPTEAWTWDTLVSAGKKLVRDTNADGYPDIFGFMDTWGGVNRFPIWIWQAGGNIWNADFTKVEIDSEASLRGLNFYHDLYFGSHIAPRTVAGQPYNEPGISTANADDLFRTGKVAMVHATRYFTPNEVSWNVAPLAKGPAGRHTMLIPSVAGIYKNTQHPQEAWEFLKFFASEEGFLAGENLNPMRSTYLGAIPPTYQLAKRKLSTRTDVNELMWLVMAEQGFVNNLRNPFAGINGAGDMGVVLNAVARGQMPLETSIREMATRWRSTLAQALKK